MKIVVVSGKGGTGKTTIASSYAALGDRETVKIDCDVDASNFHLMFDGKVNEAYPFQGAKVALIDKDSCVSCNKCYEICRFKAIEPGERPVVNELKCEGCGACRYVCKASAISLKKEITGQVMLSNNHQAYLSHAEMIAGQEGSGKLVTEVRKQGETISLNDQLLDGSPGIGCAVIASITDTDVAVVVTEPTFSGLEDMKRVLELIKHFGVKAYVIVNKYDINRKNTEMISQMCVSEKIEIIGKIPFDTLVKASINEGVPIVNFKSSPAGAEIIRSFELLKERIGL